MEANNNVKPLLKYTPENFDDIEKESKQNQQQFYNGELLAACHIQYVTNCMSRTVCYELYTSRAYSMCDNKKTDNFYLRACKYVRRARSDERRILNSFINDFTCK